MKFFLALFIYCFFYLGKAIDCGGKNITYTITVDHHGNASFRTIQSAIDSISNQNNQWVKIHIKAGLYVEMVIIPQEKPCIILEGEGRKNTIISFWDHKGFTSTNSTSANSTFTSAAPNVIASDITFKNTYIKAMPQNYKLNDKNKQILPALAANIHGDKSVFFRCGFIGYQDTLYDDYGRHYFKDCYIQGEVDFIFGTGQSYYENCSIHALGRYKNIPGFVTAQARDSLDDPSGFVFEGGSITGNGQVNLGRAWRAYSRVIFHGTHFSSIITPQGWDAWNYVGHESNFTYAEVDCKGPGANTSKRVPWLTKLNNSQLEEFSLASFINKDGWLDNLPTTS
ncbi:hypothetical protein VNO78_27082 [Psophocarpus tetragonolobus]|uniref:pectinesterase n=1 Tax=Psophocarpus tetragonolobus TaxID=3891 RepID=A0AAN9S0F2_PSOTE